MKPAFIGHYDPDRSKSSLSKLLDACQKYREATGKEPAICLTGGADARAIGDDGPIPVQAIDFFSRHVFYVGRTA